MIIKHASVQPFDFEGLSIADYTAKQNVSSSLAEITVPVGVRHKLSWSSRSDKFYYVSRGRLRFTLSAEIHDLVTGDVCVVPVGARFSYENPGPDEAVLVLVHTPSFRLECEFFED